MNTSPGLRCHGPLSGDKRQSWVIAVFWVGIGLRGWHDALVTIGYYLPLPSRNWQQYLYPRKLLSSRTEAIAAQEKNYEIEIIILIRCDGSGERFRGEGTAGRAERVVSKQQHDGGVCDPGSGAPSRARQNR